MISLISAFEIFSNPYDLCFIVGEHRDKPGTWCLVVTRGPEHRGKLIVTGEEYDSKEHAVKTILKVLTICLEKGNEIAFGNKPKNIAEDLLNTIGNSTGRNPEEAMNMLTAQMVTQIEKELNKNECCETCLWLVLLQKEDTFSIALTDAENVLDTATGRDATLEMITKNIPRLTKSVAENFKKKVDKHFGVLQ
jgi:hypothetical protein